MTATTLTPREYTDCLLRGAFLRPIVPEFLIVHLRITQAVAWRFNLEGVKAAKIVRWRVNLPKPEPYRILHSSVTGRFPKR